MLSENSAVMTHQTVPILFQRNVYCLAPQVSQTLMFSIVETGALHVADGEDPNKMAQMMASYQGLN